MFDGDRDIVLPIDSNNLEVCLQASAQSGEGVIDRDSFGSAADLSENKGDDQESDRTPSHPTAGQLSSSGTRTTHWLRYLHDTSRGLGGGVDPVGFASGVGERSVSFHRVVFHRMNSKQFPVL